jgi:hypothetical protein
MHDGLIHSEEKCCECENCTCDPCECTPDDICGCE